MRCINCDTEFQKRAGTKFCGAKCREAHWCANHPEQVLAKARIRAARWRRRHPDYSHAESQLTSARRNARWRQLNPGLERAKTSRRRAALLRRTPAWADRARIDAVYAACPYGMEVDHFYPLQGKTVSGLHVHENLQYLTPFQNRSKRNHVYSEMSAAA